MSSIGQIEKQIEKYGEKYRKVIIHANDFYDTRIRLGFGTEERRDGFIAIIMAEVKQGEQPCN